MAIKLKYFSNRKNFFSFKAHFNANSIQNNDENSLMKRPLKEHIMKNIYILFFIPEFPKFIPVCK